MKNSNYLAIYFIAGTQDVANGNLLMVLEEALQAGITCFQFREKGPDSISDKGKQKELAIACQKLCRRYQIPFFVNDDVELALAIQADGIHVGQDDLQIEKVLALAPEAMLVGLSCNTYQEIEAANQIKGIDYLGLGPIFPTQSKVDAQATVGIQLLQKAVAVPERLPIVAIGGIHIENTNAVMQTGVEGIAVISEITQAVNRQQVVAELKAKSKV